MSADTLTVLHALDGPVLTKRVTRTAGGFSIEPYDRATWFRISEVPVADFLELGRALDRIALDPTACVIRGRPLPGIDRKRCRRLVHSHVEDNGAVVLPNFGPAPRHWIACDFDSLPVPAWNREDLSTRWAAIACDRIDRPIDTLPPKGPDDGEDYDFQADGEPTPIDHRDWCILIRAAVATLPAEFHDAHAWFQFTSSHGIKNGINLRLWFWLNRAVSDLECKRWLATAPVDRSLFNAIQVHYLAPPVFDPPSADPVARRSGIWWRWADMVDVPDLPEPPPPEPPPAIARCRPTLNPSDDHEAIARECQARDDLSSWERKFLAKVAQLDALTGRQRETLAAIADPLPAKAEAYAVAALHGVETATTGGRHPTLMAVATRLYSLADEGLLDHADVTQRLLEAARKPLTAAERTQRCERHGNRPSANEEALDWSRARALAAPDLPEGFRS